MASVRVKGPSLAKTVAPIGKPSNVMHDKTVVMRAPRLKNLQTRDYGKPIFPGQQAPAMGASFGQTGLTGES